MSDKQTDNLHTDSTQTTPDYNLNLDKIKNIEILGSRLKNLIDNAERNYSDNYEKKWNYYESLYLGRREKPEGVASWRSNLFVQLCFQSIQDEMPDSMDALVGEGDFFAMQPRPGKEHLKNKASAWADLIRYFYDRADFLSVTHDCKLNAKKFGIGYVKQTWYGETRESSSYVEAENEKGEAVLAEEETERYEQGIRFEVLDPNRVYPDPDAETWKELNRYGYLTLYTWATREEIDSVSKMAGALKGQINKFMDMANDRDPYDRYKLYCIYTCKEIYMATGIDDSVNFVILRKKNPYDHGNIPVYTMTRFKRPGYIIGTGLIEKLADYNEAINAGLNLGFDNWTIGVNKHVAVREGTTIDPNLQKIEPGGISYWEDPQRDVKPLELGDVSPSTFNFIEIFLGLSQRIGGSPAGITSPQGAQQVNNKTATGASLIAYGESKKTSLEVKLDRDSYLKRILRDGIDLIRQYITQDMLENILPQEKAALINLENDKKAFWDDFDFIIKGETGYIGKRNEVEKLSTALNIIPAVMQVKQAVPEFNAELYFEQLFGVLGVPKEFVKFAPEATNLNLQDYTPQEQEALVKLAGILGMDVNVMLKEIQDSGLSIQEYATQKLGGTNAVEQSGQAGIQGTQPAVQGQPIG